MSVQAAIIFPHQLFKKSAVLDKNKRHYLVEEHLFLRSIPFIKKNSCSIGRL
jgi:hypothetical protein